LGLLFFYAGEARGRAPVVVDGQLILEALASVNSLGDRVKLQPEAEDPLCVRGRPRQWSSKKPLKALVPWHQLLAIVGIFFPDPTTAISPALEFSRAGG